MHYVNRKGYIILDCIALWARIMRFVAFYIPINEKIVHYEPGFCSLSDAIYEPFPTTPRAQQHFLNSNMHFAPYILSCISHRDSWRVDSFPPDIPCAFGSSFNIPLPCIQFSSFSVPLTAHSEPPSAFAATFLLHSVSTLQKYFPPHIGLFIHTALDAC